MSNHFRNLTRALIAGVALVCMGLAAMHLLTRAATHSMNRFTQELTEKAAQQQQARTSEAERQQETQLAIKAQQQWETEQERQQALFERERRAAFDAQYLAPKGCDNPPSNTAFTECVNHKMRARQSFFNAYTPAGINPAQSTATQTSSPIIKAGG